MSPTTTQELAAARAYYRGERIPPAALQIMDAETDAQAASGLADQVLERGAVAPDFLLPAADGRPIRLYALLERGPVVLVFYRGGWCPYCNIHLRGFQRLAAEFAASGAQVVAISPQLPDRSLSTQEMNALTFPVLSDVGLAVARSFGLGFTLSQRLLDLYVDFEHSLEDSNGPEGATQLTLPATFVIQSDRTIAYARAEVDYTQRAEPLEVLKIVRSLALQPATP